MNSFGRMRVFVLCLTNEKEMGGYLASLLLFEKTARPEGGENYRLRMSVYNDAWTPALVLGVRIDNVLDIHPVLTRFWVLV